MAWREINTCFDINLCFHRKTANKNETKNNVVYSQKSDDCHRVVIKSGSSYKMVWWNESCSWWLFLTAQPQHICNDLDQCFVNILSLTSSDLPKSERFQIKRSMMNTICRQHVRQLYSNKMLSLQSMQKLWRLACWGYGDREHHFSFKHCESIWSGKKTAAWEICCRCCL